MPDGAWGDPAAGDPPAGHLTAGAAAAFGGQDLSAQIRGALRDVPDFPIPGITFKDISPVLAHGALLAQVSTAFADRAGILGADLIAGIEARGFLLAGGVAHRARCGVLPVRKAGKLPPPTIGADYALEYGTARIEVPEVVAAGRRVYIVDDVLATGGTLAAAIDLVERAGGTVVGAGVLLELSFLAGRNALTGREIDALLVD